MAIVTAKYAGAEHLAKIHFKPKGALVPSPVLIEIGKPHKAPSRWQCGTDVVWPVLRIIEPPGIELVGNEVVCRHEIEAGD
jgi:hypothetical protein